MGLVLGCSVVLAWHFDDESTPAADGVLDRVTAGGAVVPALWHLEVANALRAASRRRRITLDYRDFVRAGLRRLDVAVDEETGAKAWTATLALSVRLGLTPYDARPMSNSPSAEAAAREPRPGDAGRGCDLGAGTPGRRALTRRTGGLPRPRREAICAGMSGSPPAAADPLGWHGTTILSVRKAGLVAMAGDGQVSLGQTVVKGNARKVRRIAQGRVLAGFAGATADAFTLLERLESKLERFPDQLERACVELAKDWRSDRYLRRLEALMAVADGERSFILTGQGDVLEPEDQIIGIGSGGNYALAAARALATVDGLSAEEVCRRAMRIAGEICVYTNDRVVLETLESRR